MKRFMPTSMIIAFGALFFTVFATPIETAVQAIDSVNSSAWRNITACVDVCDRSGCHNTCISAFRCNKIASNLSMPVTSMKVAKGINCYLFQGLNCDQSTASFIQVIGGEPSSPVLKDYHSYSCSYGRVQGRSSIATRAEAIDNTAAIAPQVATTDGFPAPNPVCVDFCDHIGCHHHICGGLGSCHDNLKVPITSMVIPKNYLCDVYTSPVCHGDTQRLLGNHNSPKLLHDYYSYSCWRALGGTRRREVADLKAVTARTEPETSLTLASNSTNLCANAPIDWIPFQRCTQKGCVSGCLKPGATCYDPATYFGGKLNGPITDMIVPKRYHCVAFTGTERCEGGFQEFIGGDSPGSVLKNLFTFFCEPMGR
ncbi:hypothetical protein FKW77_010482 [Venturia effusa]|uniref:Uncharacterized protein n=1 Tax=Venturia effusa TaxID=50376 RepID=A0A517L2E9_9PEZI|nr:hypothetical protein FKW77_010482 [Venturia effusa]